jgi:hypothetical protein
MILNTQYELIYPIQFEEFMEKNPPCKECLVKSMCIKIETEKITSNFTSSVLKINICETLQRHIKKIYPDK